METTKTTGTRTRTRTGQLQVIEPSVIRLTSDETRQLMRLAVLGKSTVSYGSVNGLVDLGLVRRTAADRKTINEIKQQMEQARRCLIRGGAPKFMCRTASKLRDLEHKLRNNRPEKLYELTPTGRALVKSITIRRK